MLAMRQYTVNNWMHCIKFVTSPTGESSTTRPTPSSTAPSTGSVWSGTPEPTPPHESELQPGDSSEMAWIGTYTCTNALETQCTIGYIPHTFTSSSCYCECWHFYHNGTDFASINNCCVDRMQEEAMWRQVCFYCFTMQEKLPFSLL